MRENLMRSFVPAERSKLIGFSQQRRRDIMPLAIDESWVAKSQIRLTWTYFIVRKMCVDELVWIGQEEVLVELFDEGAILLNFSRAPSTVQEAPKSAQKHRVPGMAHALSGNEVIA